ncbi:hypothetical protein KSS87_002178 [Heliosperma pusillum]|nr:hypothetical protein KSS87_002178 [Heliosperma pusillum]
MACLGAQTPYTHKHQTCGFHPKNVSPSSRFILFPYSINHTRLYYVSHPNLSRSSFLRCRAATPGPPPDNEPRQIGMTARFSRLWDTMQIFFAVFFWMSLFFWASASDRNNLTRGNRRK